MTIAKETLYFKDSIYKVLHEITAVFKTEKELNEYLENNKEESLIAIVKESGIEELYLTSRNNSLWSTR